MRSAKHEEVFRGYVGEELQATVDKQSVQMEENKQQSGLFHQITCRLYAICLFLNHDETPYELEEFEEEEEESKLTVERNDPREYHGPFADLEEENFYRNVPMTTR